MIRECSHEHEVAALVRAGRWSAAARPELVAHVAGCAECQDVVDIVTALESMDAGVEPPVPSAAQVWWRLAVRARAEREQAAARPVVWLQGLAAASGLGVVAAAIGQWRAVIADVVEAMAGRMATMPALVPGALPSAAADGALPLLSVAGMAAAALLVAAGVAVAWLWAAGE